MIPVQEYKVKHVWYSICGRICRVTAVKSAVTKLDLPLLLPAYTEGSRSRTPSTCTYTRPRTPADTKSK